MVLTRHDYIAAIIESHTIKGKRGNDLRRVPCPRCNIYYLVSIYVKTQIKGETHWLQIGKICPNPKCDYLEADLKKV